MTTEDKDNAITPEYVIWILEGITQGRCFPRVDSNQNEGYIKDEDRPLCESAPKIAKAYLKLHEENTRLKQKLYDERGCDVDGCEAHWKRFKEENKRLQAIVDRQRTALEFYANGYGGEFGHIAKEVLALTATDTEEK